LQWIVSILQTVNCIRKIQAAKETCHKILFFQRVQWSVSGGPANKKPAGVAGGFWCRIK
jgi:hypothetical protein